MAGGGFYVEESFFHLPDGLGSLSEDVLVGSVHGDAGEIDIGHEVMDGATEGADHLFVWVRIVLGSPHLEDDIYPDASEGGVGCIECEFAAPEVTSEDAGLGVGMRISRG